MYRTKLFFIGLLFFIIKPSFGQTEDRLDLIAIQLDSLASYGAPIYDSITISMTGPIQGFISFLAESTGLNISIDPSAQTNVSFTFTNAFVKDVILHLCEAQNLDMRLTGNIIRLKPYKPPPKIKTPKKLDIRYSGGNLSLNLNRDSLDRVVKEISRLSGANIVVQPLIRSTPINGFINNVPLETAIEQLALNNDLSYEKENSFYYLGEFKGDPSQRGQNIAPAVQTEGLYVKKISGDRVTISAIDVPVIDLIREVAIELKSDYFLLPEITFSNTSSQENQDRNRQPQYGSRQNQSNQSNNSHKINGNSNNLVSIQLRSATFEDVLREVTKNSSYTYELKNGLARIGLRNSETLRTTKVMQLQYRSAEEVLEFVPQELLLGVDIDTLLELNSLVLSGSEPNIEEVMVFLNDIDELIPVVTIELTIVDVQTNLLDEFGIEAGSIKGGKEAGGIVIGGEPGRSGFDFTLSPGSINKILGTLSNANIVNLGRVSSDFYISLKAIEEKGIIEIKSTPKLSTLNSHLANLSIGQKRYYQIQEVNFPGLDRPIPVQSTRFEEVEANLAIDITPMVSGDEQVTLDIYFEQSEFIDLPLNEPPPQVSRRFESMVRVRNGEMIVLGGLERESDSKTTSGLPWISRVPVIGWLFGKKRKAKSKNKLLIFVKPTITY